MGFSYVRKLHLFLSCEAEADVDLMIRPSKEPRNEEGKMFPSLQYRMLVFLDS